MTQEKSLQMGVKAAIWGGYTSKLALQTPKEPLACGVLWSSHPARPRRQDLLQFLHDDSFEPSLADEFFYFLAAEGGDWHGSCYFPRV